ncbi:hypothetical protein OUY22_16755 [Nonomuraea sp. MCN248]|uniref:Tissue inhibitor of metalloproteinase n=1 Tax=Nonomuraea corallina TaxID=2989783 RepID=A0ABT4SCY5_9ACTN|nr:hypothetical protein [Nonomuraea corallina]MDA0635071.1 hypothetical protein [Nonomuraea corallina]
MMIRILAVLSLVAGFLVGGEGTARACKCVAREPAERVRDADAVLAATATRVRVDEPMLDGGRLTATLRADRVFKGPARAEFEVVSRADGAACGFAFTEGTRYLVFARAGDEGLSTSLCSGNEVLEPDGGVPSLLAAGSAPRVSQPPEPALSIAVAVLASIAVVAVAIWASAQSPRQ